MATRVFAVASTIALVATAASAQIVSPLVADPITELRGLVGESDGLAEVVTGDFDDDGRADLAVRTEEGEVAILFAHGTRQYGQRLDLAAAATAIEVNPRAGRDALWIATASTISHWELDPGTPNTALSTQVASIGASRLHARFAPNSLGYGVLWSVAPGGASVRAHLFDPATGAIQYSFGAITVSGGFGATAPIDFDADGFSDLAVTWSDGASIVDSAGTVLSHTRRALTGSALADDRLAALVDIGAPRIVWRETTATAARLRIVAGSGVTTVTDTVHYQGPLSAFDVDGDGRSDLVHIVTDAHAARILFQQSSGTPFVPGTCEAVEQIPSPYDGAGGVRSAVAFDRDRDGDADFVVVGGTSVALLVNTTVDADARMPTHINTTAHPTSVVATSGYGLDALISLDEPDLPGSYDKVRYRVWRQGSPAQRLERETTPVIATSEVSISSWPLTLPLMQLQGSSQYSSIWYVEIELVTLGASSALDVVHPTLHLGLTANQGERLETEIASEGSVWVIPFAPPSFDGSGTWGSKSIPRIPRLPPPTLPPAIVVSGN
jgi:hypothetical protein